MFRSLPLVNVASIVFMQNGVYSNFKRKFNLKNTFVNKEVSDAETYVGTADECELHEQKKDFELDNN